MHSALHKTWLKISAFVIGSFGPVFALGTLPATADPARWTLDLLDWPFDGAQTLHDPDARFLCALAGGFLVGWGVTVWRLATDLYDQAPEAVRRVVVSGICSWFVVDSAGSIAAGAPSNALFNIPVLLFAVGPLWRPARAPAAT